MIGDCVWSGCHYHGSRYLYKFHCWKNCSCVLESSVTMPFQLMFLWVGTCRPLEILQNLFEGGFYLEDLHIKHGLLFLSLLTTVHHWYSLCQRWSHGFEDKGSGTTWIQPKAWSILIFLDTSWPVCQGERWVLWFLAAVSL